MLTYSNFRITFVTILEYRNTSLLHVHVYHFDCALFIFMLFYFQPYRKHYNGLILVFKILYDLKYVGGKFCSKLYSFASVKNT